MAKAADVTLEDLPLVVVDREGFLLMEVEEEEGWLVVMEEEEMGGLLRVEKEEDEEEEEVVESLMSTTRDGLSLPCLSSNLSRSLSLICVLFSLSKTALAPKRIREANSPLLIVAPPIPMEGSEGGGEGGVRKVMRRGMRRCERGERGKVVEGRRGREVGERVEGRNWGDIHG